MNTRKSAVLTCAAIVLVCAVSSGREQPSQAQLPKHTNRLAGESSPYLLQHAHNPVDWFPWGDEAFAKARKENKPVFLSVGYSACHWCHVMERQSFEDEEIAKLLNESAVSIKVDREDRPDVDDVYMTAVQLINKSGGWPMSVWLTPDGKPFYGGTYYPRDDFKKLIAAVSEAWKTRRPEIDKSADNIAEALRRRPSSVSGTPKLPSRSVAKEALAELKAEYDPTFGGFGRAPKFPPHSSFPLLFSEYESGRDKGALSLAVGTLDAMARGGIRDHLGGGFHRYSTDAKWLVPHFEKMLYDNALLARAYAEAFRITRKPQYREFAAQTLDWALREMRGPEGGFYSSLDADSEGVEGKYYVWTRKEIVDVLGRQAGDRFCAIYDVQADGNYEEQATRQKTGGNILHTAAPDVPLQKPIAEMRSRLLAERGKRVRPGLDDKRLTAWNGLMVGSLARCGQILKEPKYIQAADKTADFVLSTLRRDGKLLRSWRPNSKASRTAFLDDYAYLIFALLDLHAAGSAGDRLKQAREIADAMISRYADPIGGFFETPADGEKLLVRGKNGFDGATPSANGVAARALFRLTALTKDAKYRNAAIGTLKALGGYIERSPRATETLVLAALEMGEIEKPAPKLIVVPGKR